MKIKFIWKYFLLCFFILSCSHNPIDDFNKIKVGDDKQSVLEKAGSPVRSRFRDGKDVWTYRFIVNESYQYKEVVIQDHKVVQIRNAETEDYKEIEKKEKFIEEQLKKGPAPKIMQKKERPVIVDPYSEQSTGKSKKESFVPVEESKE